LSFQQDPPYEQYKLWFQTVLKRHRHNNPTLSDFDWQNPPNLKSKTTHSHSSKQQRRSNAHAYKQQQNNNNPRQSSRQQQTNYHRAHVSHVSHAHPAKVYKSSNAVAATPILQAHTQQSPRYHHSAAAQPRVQHHHSHSHHHHPSQHHHAHTHPPRPPSATNHTNLNPLALPNLHAQAQAPQSTLMSPTNMNMLATAANNVTNVQSQNRISNYMDRYQRCRNIITLNKQQQQQTIPGSNSNSPILATNSNANPLAAQNSTTAAQLQAAQQQLANMCHGYGHTAVGVAPPPTATQQQQRRVSNGNSFMQSYEELLAGYGRLQKTNDEYKAMLANQQAAYKKVKQTNNNYMYQLQHLQKQNEQKQMTIDQLNVEIQSYRNAMGQPSQKRRKLNHGLNRI